jgi:hypothetical protein
MLLAFIVEPRQVNIDVEKENAEQGQLSTANGYGRYALRVNDSWAIGPRIQKKKSEV